MIIDGQHAATTNRELALFLRARRQQLSALAAESSGPHRRETGMRQEDVAYRAGLSTRLYAGLERGEVANPSPQTLDAVARALNMDSVARSTLYLLAARHQPPGLPDPVDEPSLRSIGPTLRTYLTLLEPAPAYVTGPAWDILMWNAAVAEWFTDLDRTAEQDRNVLWWLFTDEAARRVPDVHREREMIVARLRVTYARHLDDPRFTRLIRRLLDAHDEARHLWARQPTAAYSSPSTRRLRHPRHGEVEVLGALSELPGGLRIAVFLPPLHLLDLHSRCARSPASSVGTPAHQGEA